jgi:uncharacterized protein YfaS (alpha-2-macroglobulin family)
MPMSESTYTVGDLVHVVATFTNAAGTNVNPTAVTAKSKAPDGTITTLTVAHDSLGVYSADVNVTESGQWTYRFAGTGSNQAAQEARFRVNDSAFD